MRILPRLLGLLFCLALLSHLASAQTETTGAFEGTVTDSLTTRPIAGARAEIINLETNVTIVKRTDLRGQFYQGLLAPGVYRIRVTMPNYQPYERLQRLRIASTGEVIPVPVALELASATALPTAAPPVTMPVTPPPPSGPPPVQPDVRAEINTLDARRSGSFSEVEVAALPLGAITFTRTFDELALLLPGVAPPPQTLGSVAGPGQGAGVGSAGQFAVNGLRSRANNFTVDGSDNNDEDIGVRRQGFLALIPQPLESIKEYQAITLLAPAQFGRNLGAQVNAVSKAGGSRLHSTLYGLFNSSQFNAHSFFDAQQVVESFPLQSAGGQPVLLDGNPLIVRRRGSGEDSLTFGQAGFTLGGAIRPETTFFFLAGEGQLINAAREEHFAVPTVEQRGLFGSGASGLTENRIGGGSTATLPTSFTGAMVFSLFPFPNNPQGIYGANTFTQLLPAGARGAVALAKLDQNFDLDGRTHTLTGRYNQTDDRRDIPVVGEAIFSTLRSRVNTRNLSVFLNSPLTAPEAKSQIFNQLRLSYGRTRLRFVPDLVQPRFDDVRDAVQPISTLFPGESFLLNAPYIVNLTAPNADGSPNRSAVNYIYQRNARGEITSTDSFGPLGQLVVAGFSPLGLDVFNFPQTRVNNTYQLADHLTWRWGRHGAAYGMDLRRSELNSDLRRLSRPLAVFNGGPRLDFRGDRFQPLPAGTSGSFLRPEDFAAVAAPSSLELSLDNGQAAGIGLRFYQYNFYAQDEWRVRSDLSLSFGLRYERATPPRELNGRIEETFQAPALNLAGARGLREYLDGRREIFTPDRNDFAPRLAVAYGRNLFGRERVTVWRAGYGVFYDQILGAVVSQSRNVFPSFLTVNYAGIDAQTTSLTYNNPALTLILNNQAVAAPNTVNRLNPALPLDQALLDALRERYPSALSLTLPRRRLTSPLAHHFSFSTEQQLGRSLTIAAAYVGTAGRHLLRETTPNLGSGTIATPTGFGTIRRPIQGRTVTLPQLSGILFVPGTKLDTPLNGRFSNRPVADAGAVNIFETTAASRYDALQLQLRGSSRTILQFEANYTFATAQDDVSDVFDLAGAAALPQNSLTFAGERGPANFDVRHSFNYYLLANLTSIGGKRWRWMLGGLQLAGLGRARSGQPFTVNSIYDINLDGNLTDRLDTTTGLLVTGDRLRPLRLVTADALGLLARPGQDGRVGRNTFRSGNVIELNVAVTKRFELPAAQHLELCVEVYNILNRANFGVPVRFLEAPGFGQAAQTVTPARRVQFSVKYWF